MQYKHEGGSEGSNSHPTGYENYRIRERERCDKNVCPANHRPPFNRRPVTRVNKTFLYLNISPRILFELIVTELKHIVCRIMPCQRIGLCKFRSGRNGCTMSHGRIGRIKKWIKILCEMYRFMNTDEFTNDTNT